jgi:hypothetical protein
MLTVQDFVLKYEKYTDDELLEIHSSLHDYSDEAKEGFKIVVAKRGGEDTLLKLKEEKKVMASEIARINNHISKLIAPGVDVSFIKKMVPSEILSPETYDVVINDAFYRWKADFEDKEVKPNTIFGSIVGGIVASIVGGIFWGLQLIYSKKIFGILVVGIAIVCYAIIRLFARKSYKNNVVFITAIIAVCMALVVGYLLYDIVGYLG